MICCRKIILSKFYSTAGRSEKNDPFLIKITSKSFLERKKAGTFSSAKYF
jgi:hypothetical protein